MSKFLGMPSNFDTVPEATGGATRPEPGTYVCKVMWADAGVSKAGRPMLIIDFDIAEGPFSDWYAHDNADRATNNRPQRWLRMYQVTDGALAGRFKHLLKDFERSNAGWRLTEHITGSGFDTASLIDLKVGLVCIGEEYESEGKLRMSLKPDVTIAASKVRSGDIPEAKIKGVDGKWRKASEPPPTTKPGTNELEDRELTDIEIPF